MLRKTGAGERARTADLLITNEDGEQVSDHARHYSPSHPLRASSTACEVASSQRPTWRTMLAHGTLTILSTLIWEADFRPVRSLGGQSDPKERRVDAGRGDGTDGDAGVRGIERVGLHHECWTGLPGGPHSCGCQSAQGPADLAVRSESA